MLILVLDVDGVLLDPARGGRGPWTNELLARFDIDERQIDEAFFGTSWGDVMIGRRSVEDGLAEALRAIGSTADVEAVLSCWFDADYVPFETTFELARRAVQAGYRLALATNQEHRRAAYLRRRIGAAVPLDDVIYSADIGCSKRDARFFDIASERLGLRVDERSTVVFVDDDPANVAAAGNAGWHAIHASPHRPWRSDVERLLALPPRGHSA